jgi:riboflavin kinase/FMN adenylyltransferase
MKIYRKIEEIHLENQTVVTVGSFDGIHLGHQEILKELNRQAREDCDCLEILITFDPHPKEVLGKSQNHIIEVLTPLEEKLKILKDLGLPAVLIIPFTREFSQTNYRDFVKELLVDKLHIKKMVVGYDHTFGKNREGHPAQLKQLGKEFGFSVTVLDPYYLDGKIVNSSTIRSLFKKGDVESAQKLLGRPYSLSGIVEEGDGRGRELGYPTANLALKNSHKLIPHKGVYAVDVQYNSNSYKGMMNIGNRPTFNFDPLTLEVHIFNFSGSIYGSDLKVFFKKFIREEIKFENAEALKKQMLSDKEICIKI